MAFVLDEEMQNVTNIKVIGVLNFIKVAARHNIRA